MRILAIETSCDETAAAVLETKNSSFKLVSNVISSQVKIHAKFGGIIPEVAARKQMEMIIPVLEQALKPAISNFQFPISKQITKSIDYLAVTQGPGLITSLTVGVETAKTLAYALNKPLIFVNHLAGHIYSSLLKNSLLENQSINLETIKFPALALIVSGGHTMLVLMKKHHNYKIIGETLDDAVGEAYDKVAKILNLGYPGGPIIDKMSLLGDQTKFSLPRPMLNSADLNFSFSGLKTAVMYLVKDLKTKKQLNKNIINDLCACFQTACVDVLTHKTLSAIKKFKPQTFLLGGGVAANKSLRENLTIKISELDPKIKILIPEIKFTGDNAAMIALAAYYKITNTSAGKKNNYLKVRANPNLKL
ncbi:MAG TPA: tRNA (adenosine(37)-N6)-threonylcarbamoyltransferase complex transferase subunit TsaD [bacterium]|mgnify:CR=1 FL=1|nr:tRNA (adenosine(37)-N6)-threonylcarbamoyltransferase complex transferase subunit TsaD [bacterium]